MFLCCWCFCFGLYFGAGVDTPEDLRDDDEWERTVEEEHRRVMQKAKAEKKQREREEQLSLGISKRLHMVDFYLSVFLS